MMMVTTSIKQTRKSFTMKALLILFSAMSLTACVTLNGNYELKAIDAAGQSLNTGMVLTATGSGIYTARNALCQKFPKAKVIIINMQTNQELASESPYQCR
jgi:20S proteasome alpha/beta subunit